MAPMGGYIFATRRTCGLVRALLHGDAMKKILALLLSVVASFVQACPDEIRIVQRDVTDTLTYTRQMCPPNYLTLPSLMVQDQNTQSLVAANFTGMTWDGTTLSVTSSAVNADWNASSGLAQILNKPTTLSGFGITDGVSATALTAVLTSYATTSALATKYTTPTGSSAQYVRGDGTLATLPTQVAFDFSQPASRTLAVSTDYQASNTAKAAILYPSFACTNATTILAASSCTVQVRQGSSSLTCSTGTVVYTINLSVSLGLLITQASTNPAPLFVPIGGHFVFCPSAGTFTVSAIEQSAG